MVSTRQMSIVGGGGGTNSTGGTSGASSNGGGGSSNGSDATEGPSGRSSRHGGTPALLGAGSLPPPSPLFSTTLLDLPDDVFVKIFKNLKYKTVAHMRMVCRRTNDVCGSYLNSSFQKLVAQTLNEFQTIKSKMPRRESARRNHSLACEFDVIETVHMRLSLLQMTFGKHIERKYCCFFPGEILDEVDNILEYLKVTTKLARPFKLTDELFDLSTMAMEFFKEHMEPILPEINSPQTSGSNGAGGDNGEAGGSPMHYEEDYFPPSPPPPQSNMVLRKRIHRIKQGMKRYNNQLSELRSDLRSYKRKFAWQQKLTAEHQRLLAEQQKQLMEVTGRLEEHDKKNEETSRKFQTLLQELNKCRTELQYWRSKSPATTPVSVCAECGDPMIPNLIQQFSLESYLAEDVFNEGFRRLASPPESTRPTSPGGAPPAASMSSPTVVSVTDSGQNLENSLSTKGAGASNGKTPGSPKSRRPTSCEKSHSSSDEGSSKRSAAEISTSPQDSKKRRFHRSAKPRKQ